MSIENYPGQTVEGESGPSLIARMTEQAAKFGCDRVAATVEKVVLEGDVKKVITSKGEEICGRYYSCYRCSLKTDWM